MSSPTKIAAERRALLLIDFQRDFLESSGKMPVARDQVLPVLSAAAQAIAEARSRNDFVVAIGNEFRPGDFLMNALRRYASVAGSEGSRWTDKLPFDSAKYFPKWAGSAFVNRELDTWLRAQGISTLLLTGVFAKACVTATAKDALTKGYAVHILADAVACKSDASRARALARLEARGAVLCKLSQRALPTQPVIGNSALG